MDMVRSAVFTWAQPPKEVVTGVPVPLINSPEDRAWLAKSLYGIDDVIMVPFNKEMMTTSWEDFVTEILIRRYHAVHLVAGHGASSTVRRSKAPWPRWTPSKKPRAMTFG